MPDDAATDIAMLYGEAEATGTISITNNLFYSPNTETTIDWDGTTYTVTAADAALAQMSANQSTDPDLNADYLPLGGSDAIGNGIAPASIMDYYGRILPNAVYHIGAVWPAEAAPIYGSLLGPWLGMGGFASDVSGYGATPAEKALLLETTTGDSLVETTTGDELIEA